MVFRHGTRYPSANDVNRLNEMLTILRRYVRENKVLKEHIGKILNLQLQLPFSEATDKALTNIGVDELYTLGKRFQKRFPELFMEPFSVKELKFSSTCKDRSVQSADAFKIGFLEGRKRPENYNIQPATTEIIPCESDQVLRYFDLCKKYQNHVVKNVSSSREMRAFLDGDEVSNVVRNVKERLKLNDDDFLTADHVLSMYLYCAYRVSILNESIQQSWCQLFDENDLEVMEYVLDLKAFHKRSTAYKITYESSCPLLQDIFSSILAKSEYKMKDGTFRGIFRFCHAETIIPLYALMGLFLDKEHLTAENFNKMRQRHFRGSKLAPFAGNIAIVLYQCQGNEYKIQFYSNEQLVKLPCCDSEKSCPLDKFKHCYQKIIDNCDFDKICQNGKEKIHRKEL
eukprot:gene14078-15547_t